MIPNRLSFKSAIFLLPLEHSPHKHCGASALFCNDSFPYCHTFKVDIPWAVTRSSIYSLYPWQEGAVLPLLKTTPLLTCSGQKTKEALKANAAAVLHSGNRLYVQLGQFAALLLDICAWRMAEYMSLTGKNEGRQVPVLWWKTADTVLVPVAPFCFIFALILVSESPARRGRVTSALTNWLQEEMKAHRTMK